MILIIQKKKNFTEKLFLYVDNDLNSKSEMRVVIEKLYNKELDLKLYNTVLLFIINIKIINQFFYVTQFLKEYYNYKVKTRKIVLF